MSVLGAGLLVGTALAVIIPEGVRALFSGAGSVEGHTPTTGHGNNFIYILIIINK